jgi:hypothetical protein
VPPAEHVKSRLSTASCRAASSCGASLTASCRAASSCRASLTHHNGNGCLPDDEPVVGQAETKGALQGTGGVDSKPVGTRGGLSNGCINVLQGSMTGQRCRCLRHCSVCASVAGWVCCRRLTATAMLVAAQSLLCGLVHKLHHRAQRPMHADGTGCCPMPFQCCKRCHWCATAAAHLGQMVQQDLSVACDHGGGSWVALPLAHGGEELVPCLGGRDEHGSPEILGVQDVLEHWVQGQVGVLACNQVQGCFAVLATAGWGCSALLLFLVGAIIFGVLCVHCYEGACGQANERSDRATTFRPDLHFRVQAASFLFLRSRSRQVGPSFVTER